MFVFLFAPIQLIYAQSTGVVSAGQNETYTGTVLDESGEPIIGATVKVVGGTTGVMTDLDGSYSISAPAGSQLKISYVGYTTKTITKQNAGNVILSQGQETLQEVVVTALGIKRSQKALSYNVQEVSNRQLNTVKSTNFMNTLSGKVAGVSINASSAGMGGSTKVVMRGPKSINQSNQALYVIDGVPVTNTTSGATEGLYASQPTSEGIADLNSEDIESISVLSGPAAAALYGSAAAQGVIMITTKKGAEGKVNVSISNSTQFSNAFLLPEFQNSYINRPGNVMSWGEKAQSVYGDYNPADFFNTGTNIQNTVTMTTGTKNNQTYASIGTTNATGIITNNTYDRYNFTYRNTTKFLDDKMTLDFAFNYIKEKDKNLMAQGQYQNPIVPVYLFPRGESFDAAHTFEVWDPSRNIYVQNWNMYDLSMQNPYWIAKRNNRINNKNRYVVSSNLRYQVLDWLELSGRARYDVANTKHETKNYASTIMLFANSEYGFYGYSKIDDVTFYGDFMANINKYFLDDKFSLVSNIGISTNRVKYDSEGFQGGLKAPSNIFSPNAIDYAAATNDNRPIFAAYRHVVNSAFANLELGWKSMLYLTLTGRNDWDSALHGTSHEMFFYPSVGLSAVLSEMMNMPQFLNNLKIRGSWASVGSAISPNITSAWRYPYSPKDQSYGTITYKMPTTFYPERTNSWELGLTGRFFNNDLTLDATLYQSNTHKQLFLRPLSASSGYDSEYVQTGNVRNRGIEFALGYGHTWDNFRWDSHFTWSANRNRIMQLMVGHPEEVINKGGLSGASIILKDGGTMGDVYTSTDFRRDNEGNIYINANGNIERESLSNPEYRGSVLPKSNFGFSNDFTWKGINLGFLITARVGGIVLSQTQAILDQWGVSQRSANARDAGGIAINKGYLSAENYFSVVGGNDPIWSEYIYSADNVRLQELHIGYTIPKKVLRVCSLSLGLTAHNVLMIYNKAPFDPESVGSTGTYYQGFDYFMQPSMRSLGFNVKMNF